MAMGHEYDIGWAGLAVHVVLLNGLDFLDQIVQSVRYLLCRPDIIQSINIDNACRVFVIEK